MTFIGDPISVRFFIDLLVLLGVRKIFGGSFKKSHAVLEPSQKLFPHMNPELGLPDISITIF
jgi:hypothetical protein